ncbi:DUF456 domain-containing protein [Bacillus alkalisoli]|uniref:DUF456 domain-containing protein n=1 Tax=Bacillus alkalisoli TaxID=2011008 RepID=UPI000C234F62|nr:DUF456 domain-containing protein [Bacillus alkalisoli]
MDFIYWLLLSILIVLSFVGLIYPIIPSVLLLVGAFLLYGVFFTFEPFSFLFWAIQLSFVALLFVTDYVASVIGVKKFGGSNYSVWGSTLGLIVGPFVIPVIGIIAGPFIGAFIAEIIFSKKSLKEAMKIGTGSVVGLFTSIVAKGIIQIIMVVYFIIVVL